MFCKFCGNVLEDHANFCGACGNQVDAAVQAPPSKGGKVLSKIIFGGLLLLVGIAVIAVVILRANNVKTGYNNGEYLATVEEVKSISGLYPDVDWSDGNLNREIGTVVDTISTDLEKKEDYRTIRYDFATNTAKINGTMERKYILRDKEWIFDSVTEHTESFEWSLAGEYEFVLDDEIYCNIMIESVDFANQIAHVHWYGRYEDDFAGVYSEEFLLEFTEIIAELEYTAAEGEEKAISFGDYEVSISGDRGGSIRFGMLATKEDLFCRKSSTRVPSGAAAVIYNDRHLFEGHQKVGGIK